jgi:tetratricopeptide (TPR) repeat protein
LSSERVGDVQLLQSDFAGALKSYDDSLAIAERLAQSDTSNARWQRDLAAIYSKLGVAYIRMKDIDNALAALRQGQMIMDRLTKLSPESAAWKKDLAWFDNLIAKLAK